MPQISAIPILDNLQVSTLIDWNDVSRVRKIKTSDTMLSWIDGLNVNVPYGSKRVDVLEYRQTSLGDTPLRAIALNTAVVGGNLDVTFDPAIDFFRKDAVMHGTNRAFQGKVVASSPGSATLAPYGTTTIANLLSTIVIGEFAHAVGVTGPYRDSGPTTALYNFPDVEVNYLSTMRETHKWNRVDKHAARIEYKPGMPWEDGGVTEMVKRYLGDLAWKAMFQTPHFNSATSEAEFGGIDWSIRNRGGVVFEFSALPTESQWLEWLYAVNDRKLTGMGGKRKKMFMGRRLYSHITRTFSAGTIAQDTQEARSGAIDTNARFYKVGGIDVELVHEVDIFQDPNFDNVPTAGIGMTGMKKEWGCYFIDDEPVPTVGGGSVPAIEKIHFGESPLYIGNLQGIDSCPVGMIGADAEMYSGANYKVPTSLIDRSEIGLMSHCGYNMVTGEYSGYFGASI